MGERTALIADIHGNSPALRAVLDDIRAQGCKRLFVLGDIINGMDPGGCVDLLLEWPGIAGIKGNAELYLLTPDLGEFPLRDQGFYVELIDLIEWWRSRLSAAQVAWLAELPEVIRWGASCLAHDSPLDRLFPERRWIPETDAKYQELRYHAPGIAADMAQAELQRLLDWMESEAITDIFCSHTHDPFYRIFGARRICNVGSVGLPLDGDPRATWALVEGQPDGTSSVTIRRLGYSIDAIQRIIDVTPSYPSFARPGMQAAYRQMLERGVHWRHFLTSK